MGIKIDAGVLARQLGDWTETGVPYPKALASAIGYLIDENALAEGAILPPQRVLAQKLGLSRGTVSMAYELLGAEDHIASLVGSGSRVRHGRLAQLSEQRFRPIDLSNVALPALSMVAEAMENLDQSRLSGFLSGDGYYPHGIPALREAIAIQYSRDGLPTSADEILVTAGAQQATWLVTSVLVSSGDTVLLEEPTYRGALEAFRSQGAQLVSVPMTEAGISLQHLSHLLGKQRYRLLYCQPSAHNPTGIAMSEDSKFELGRLIDEHGLLAIEDACSADLVFDRSGTETPLAAYASPGRVITIGTASKLFWGGLRIGWVRAEKSLIDAMAAAKKTVDRSGPVFEQLVAVDLIGMTDEARFERRTMLREGLSRCQSLVYDLQPHWTWIAPKAGTGLWVDTDGDALELIERGRAHHVYADAGSAFSAHGAFPRHIRLPIWHPQENLREGLTRLVSAPPQSSSGATPR